jgi:hypothetical protein
VAAHNPDPGRSGERTDQLFDLLPKARALVLLCGRERAEKIRIADDRWVSTLTSGPITEIFAGLFLRRC